MKIKNIKVNAYGNIENKDINLEEGINIIHGANESGKSTLLNYIISIFYGISRNKDGKALSDYEKYKPWNSNEFSGRISYKLENGEKYEIFRDFNKKNPKIYNDKLEDISDRFETDKKDGSKFFIEQMGIDKQMYLSTVVSTQEEVRLDEKNQNMLIQKIANLAGTGEDNVSYKKALIKLQEKIRDRLQQILFDYILDAKEIDQVRVLKELAIVEQDIYDSLASGKKEYYKPVKIKSASSYENPMRIQGVKAAEIYNSLRDPHVTAIDLDQRNSLDIVKLDLNEKNAIKI